MNFRFFKFCSSPDNAVTRNQADFARLAKMMEEAEAEVIRDLDREQREASIACPVYVRQQHAPSVRPTARKASR